eukprot:gnl/TRDRNA2_/TRDRNA2_38267_c0_seq1.p1 gnl/TRDRNA2_/TRDRNA2_38267_c0~~gnl/TRDRNA2_/TRDRNA2_38267_c0_seq1.p1  ORF type:complete len:371 (+),score=53.31 gnl/TRDRNA2_/TRDRNA2_38267_c0_seq1:107-1219(+)
MLAPLFAEPLLLEAPSGPTRCKVAVFRLVAMLIGLSFVALSSWILHGSGSDGVHWAVHEPAITMACHVTPCSTDFKRFQLLPRGSNFFGSFRQRRATLPTQQPKKAWSREQSAGRIEASQDMRRAVPSKVWAAATMPLEAGQEEEHELSSFKPYVFGEESVRAAIAAVKDGKVVVVVDDEDRENEGDLIMAAEKATPESIGFFVRYTSGVLCVSLKEELLQKLKLPPMVVDNEDPKGTAYAISVDAKHGTSTGISAADRAVTFRKLVDPTSTAEDFTRPGHIFPLRYHPGGVLERMGHTEATLDLTEMAGLHPGGVLAEVVNDDGSMMRLESPNGGLRKFSIDHGLVLTSIQDIIAFRQRYGDRSTPENA